MKTKKAIYKIIEQGDHGSKYNLIFDYSIMSLIVLNLLSLALESIPEVKDKYGIFMNYFEAFSVIVFSIEYALRIYVSDLVFQTKSKINSASKFIFSTYGILDLISILPFYLPLFFGFDLLFIRIIRLFRFVRILKIGRYNDSLSLIFAVVREKKGELISAGFVATIILIIASFLMYYVEGDVQPDKFPNVLACFWWAVATLTTVGYGDVFPVTALGKVLSGIIAVLGIGLVALPAGLISAGFMEKISNKKEIEKKCPHCGQSIEH